MALTVLLAVGPGFVGCQSDCAVDRPPHLQPAPRETCALSATDRGELLTLINRRRSQTGRAPLFYDEDLNRAAARRAAELAPTEVLTHGEGPTERLKRLGLIRSRVAENLARYIFRADGIAYIVEYWSNGGQERENLFSAQYLRVGAAMSPGQQHCYTVLLLTE